MGNRAAKKSRAARSGGPYGKLHDRISVISLIKESLTEPMTEADLFLSVQRSAGIRKPLPIGRVDDEDVVHTFRNKLVDMVNAGDVRREGRGSRALYSANKAINADGYVRRNTAIARAAVVRVLNGGPHDQRSTVLRVINELPAAPKGDVDANRARKGLPLLAIRSLIDCGVVRRRGNDSIALTDRAGRYAATRVLDAPGKGLSDDTVDICRVLSRAPKDECMTVLLLLLHELSQGRTVDAEGLASWVESVMSSWEPTDSHDVRRRRRRVLAVMSELERAGAVVGEDGRCSAVPELAAVARKICAQPVITTLSVDSVLASAGIAPPPAATPETPETPPDPVAPEGSAREDAAKDQPVREDHEMSTAKPSATPVTHVSIPAVPKRSGRAASAKATPKPQSRADASDPVEPRRAAARKEARDGRALALQGSYLTYDGDARRVAVVEELADGFRFRMADLPDDMPSLDLASPQAMALAAAGGLIDPDSGMLSPCAPPPLRGKAPSAAAVAEALAGLDDPDLMAVCLKARHQVDGVDVLEDDVPASELSDLLDGWGFSFAVGDFVKRLTLDGLPASVGMQLAQCVGFRAQKDGVRAVGTLRPGTEAFEALSERLAAPERHEARSITFAWAPMTDRGSMWWESRDGQQRVALSDAEGRVVASVMASVLVELIAPYKSAA